MSKRKVTRFQPTRWFYSRSRFPFELKKPKGFEEWFYTGPSLDFGHPNDIKKRSKGK